MLAQPEFWVAVAFVIFFFFVFRAGAHTKMGSALDKRASLIVKELAEARQLRAEAEAVLKEYEAKRNTAEAEAAAIVQGAKEEAERIAAEAHEKMTDFVARRTAAAEQRIAQAESQATAEVRAAAAEAAVRAAETVLRDTVKGAASEQMFSKSLAEVTSKLN